MNKKMIKPRYFKFPSLGERKALSNAIPKYERLNFNQINAISSALNREYNFDEINRIDNLYYWNYIFSKKLFKLSETHLFLLTHYERGFKEKILECNQRELVDNILFNYFTEIFYYFFFSALETLAHILNKQHKLKFKDHKVKFNNELIEKIENESIKSIILKFNCSIENAREKRNSFTHRFPKNEKDFRTKSSVINGRNTLSAGSGEFISNYEFLKNINESSELFKKLLDNLKLEIK